MIVDPRDAELAALRAELAEAQATLDAIRSGEVDAVVVDAGQVNGIYNLESVDLPYRQLLEQMADGALSLDRGHAIQFCNPFFCELVGASWPTLDGRSLMELLDLDGQHALAAAIEDGRVARLSVDLMRVDGERVPVRMTITPPNERSPRRTTVTVADQRVQTRLRRVTRDRDRAKAESEAKDRFIATLGHELRSPLAALMNGVTVLGRIAADVPAVSRVQPGMERQLRHLRALVDDLLDLTRVAQGKIVLKRERCALRDLLAGAAETLEERRGSLRVTLDPPDLELFVDPTRVEQILVNLIGNAARYSEPDTPIEVAAGVDRDHLVLRITDHGVGLTADDLERIFEPFVQVTAMSGGLGIGLSLVRQLVELHGGNVSAWSEGLGRGTTFEVVLPAIDGQRRTGASASAPVAATARTILVVDDNRDAAEMLALLLATDGHDVVIAGSGGEAIERVRVERPAVVLLDIGLPDVSGYEVARHLRTEHGAGLVIVAVTGFSHDDARRASAEAGFDAHLVKPVEPDAVGALLGRLVR